MHKRAKRGEIQTKKANGKDNPIYKFTEQLRADEFHKHFKSLDFEMQKRKPSKSFIVNAVIDTKGYDHWIVDEQCVIRVHVEPRRNFCSPFQCRGGSKVGVSDVDQGDSRNSC